MAEPAEKRLKSGLPRCACHRSSSGQARGALALQAAVEEALCGVSSLLFHGVYKLQALASVFERDDCALPGLAWFFCHTAQRQQEEAQELLRYLSQRGGTYCGRDMQRAGCESVCGVLPALDLLGLQLSEEVGVLLELIHMSRDSGDPQTCSVLQSLLVSPRVERLKQLADLLSTARRLGCTADSTGRFGEYLLCELQEELRR
ncbi:ferritin, heavy subunit [Eucyclogobius newberryi]|uniref:ferritin, heavy subunit n=1 Tax=Eucyclogobius newberryi TaxID=166745 RepID=UPI003B5A1208